MRIELRVNNGSTTLLLVDDAGVVRNEWPVTLKEMEVFVHDGGDPADWAASYSDHAPRESYGELVAYRTVNGLEVVSFDAFVNRVKFFGMEARFVNPITGEWA